MLTSEAQTILRQIERRLKPSRAPFNGDDEAFKDWTQLLTRYESDIVGEAFTAHREAGSNRWPDYYTFRDLLKRASSMRRHPSNTGGCDNCGGTGWQVPFDDQHDAKTLNIRGMAYSYCEPCSCPHGADAERSDTWTKSPRLCHACNGVGWFSHRPDEVERCENCGGSGVERP